MRDIYFYTSLFSTLLIYTTILCFLVTFVVVTGIIGALVILFAIIVLFIFFYDGFKTIKNMGKYTSH
ncbi:MAG: hypothetical protein JETT_2016 [Candidatus Jettenia ecosi]|uniref:Uncharacterized protein n=1 Tax=Candidatus Jettenia ecosi TaxID=2494326 RepID=A0A533QGD0_9BACT|nr:MAG: hypothetical protein JETT_2016 [Candidatus Jettenia ecosi]